MIGNVNRARTSSIPDQRVSESKKQQAKWYIPNADYWIGLALGQNDKTITQKFLDAANGIVDAKTYGEIADVYQFATEDGVRRFYQRSLDKLRLRLAQ